MRIPESKIEEVRAANDVLSVVQGYVALKAKGANHWGLCPFHSEDTPSFAVNPSKQIYHCFGCGRGGSVINFIMEIEKLTFVEAVRLLAEKAGIQLPATRETDSGELSEAELLVKANTLARDYFFHQIQNSNADGAAEARAYLEARGYGKAVIERFMLGYAPDSWDGLVNQARKSGLNTELLAVRRTKRLIRRRSWFLGLALLCSLLIITYQIGPAGVRFTLQDYPELTFVFALLAVAFWYAWHFTRRKLEKTGL